MISTGSVRDEVGGTKDVGQGGMGGLDREMEWHDWRLNGRLSTGSKQLRFHEGAWEHGSIGALSTDSIPRTSGLVFADPACSAGRPTLLEAWSGKAIKVMSSAPPQTPQTEA